MQRLGFIAAAVAIGLAAAPELFAQSRYEVLVCRDGQVTSTQYGSRACDRHGGIDQNPTLRARRNVYGQNGVYDGNERGVYNGNGSVYGIHGTNSDRGVYNGNSGVYNGGVYSGSVNPSDRGVYGGINSGNANGVYERNGVIYDRNGNAIGRVNDDEHHDNGRHLGQKKHHRGNDDRDR